MFQQFLICKTFYKFYCKKKNNISSQYLKNELHYSRYLLRTGTTLGKNAIKIYISDALNFIESQLFYVMIVFFFFLLISKNKTCN